jgi:very-short-patch-repair endonuclease
MRPKQHRIPPEQMIKVRRLRRDTTFPERLLWSRLRTAQVAGLKFRRQHPVGPFVVDFYCAEASLVVELDGRSHDGKADSDEQRSSYLRGLGLRVIRYTNDEVLEDIDAVVEEIARHAGWPGASARDPVLQNPPLSPP